MALDPSIALGVRPIEVPNPLAQYGQLAQIQGAQNQNALAQYQLSAAKRADEQTNAMNELYSKHYNPATNTVNQNALYGELAQRGFGGQIPVMQAKAQELEGKIATTSKTKADAAAERQKLIDLTERDTSRDPSDANITRNLGYIQSSDLFTPQEKTAFEAKMQQMLTVPLAKRAEMMSQAGASASDYTSRGQLKVSQGQLAVSQGQLKVAQERENRLAQGPIGTTLTPEQNDALFGENGAVSLGKLNPNKINSRNAKMWADAFIKNPSADPVKVAQDVVTADKAIKDFGTGPQGVKVTSFNTAIDHLDTLDKLGAALKSGDIKAFNAIANTLGVQTGGSAATMYNQAAKIVGGEISKAIVPGVGTKAEREEAANAFNSAMSPEQLTGASATAKKLLGGQLSSLELQYKRTTKREDFADQFLSPAARAAYQSTRPAAAPAAPSATQSGATVSNW